ncbi:MAG: extracellular solute-binding protein [Candidatus Poseidoniales archaeon]|nr:MAG: extracellular solute-binding protein [Candidatus Poseidoniales archaeon]
MDFRIHKSMRLRNLLLVFLLILPGCLGESEEAVGTISDADITIEVWYTFAAETIEEEVFLNAVSDFSDETGVSVKATRVSYGDADQLFMTAAQGGEAPDLIRISSDSLGKFGEVRVDGAPLFEDLRPHLTPQERSKFDSTSLESMRYGDSLYAVPASFDCLSLIYNKALFDGIEEPNENWTLEDLKTAGSQVGLEFPVKNAYWWFPFLGGYGGQLFDENGVPTLDENGAAESLEWMMDLELEHGIVPEGTQKISMENSFEAWDAGMVIDGPWNWARYGKGIDNLGQTLLPKVSMDGEHLSPLVTYKGWAVSKQSPEKVAATQLALFLSSDDVQKQFALQTYTIPTAENLKSDSEILANPIVTGFIEQAELGTPAPTTRGMSMVYTALAPAFEQVYTGTSDAQSALTMADRELEDMLDEADWADEAVLIEGYRTVEIEFEIGEGNHTILVDGNLHSTLIQGDTEIDSFNGCLTSYSTETQFQCSLTGMIPNQEHHITVNDSTGMIYEEYATSSIEDILPESRGTSGVLFAIGSIIVSLIALLSYGAWKDREKTSAKGSHFYIAPALLALAVLTFYPVFYGFWLSLTDASQTHLGDESFIGLSNFIEVFTSEGFLKVTLFTLIWTVSNVLAHIAIGLFLAILLNDERLRGRVGYRTIMLLPWAIPSYISVLIWRGIFQPDGLLNDLLGTDLNLLADPTGAQVVVILVNIWLGVPFMMMSLSGALQSIPKEMYEAAEVDGVNSWDQFRHLTLPNLKSALVPLSLLGFIWTFNMFNVIYLMTDGGPNLGYGPGSTDILITYVYDVAFIDGKYGVAAAWSVVIFAMLLIFSWRYMKQTNATEAVS